MVHVEGRSRVKNGQKKRGAEIKIVASCSHLGKALVSEKFSHEPLFLPELASEKSIGK